MLVVKTSNRYQLHKMVASNTPSSSKLNHKSYYRTLEKGDVKRVVKDLIKRLPDYGTELRSFQDRIFRIESQEIRGVVTNEEVDVAMNKIVQTTLVFLDDLSKGDESAARRSLLDSGVGNPALDLVIEKQLEFGQKSVKENSTFRGAVGLIFLAAIMFSMIVTYNHREFLREDFQVVALIGLNILLYICIGLLALYALTLIIRGSKVNKSFLDFARQSSRR